MEELLLLTNPKKRRGRKGRRGGFARGAKRLGLSPAAATSILKPALVGALGAVGNNWLLSQLATRGILPATLMTGKTRFLTQAVVAIGAGIGLSKLRFVGSANAVKAAEGALTVTLANLITETAQENGVNLSGMGYYLPGFNPGRAFPNAGASPSMMAGMGKYMTGPGAPGFAGLAGRHGTMGNVTPLRRASGMRNISSSFSF